MVRPSSTGEESGHAGSEELVATPEQPPARRVSLVVLSPAPRLGPARGWGKALSLSRRPRCDEVQQGGADGWALEEELRSGCKMPAPDCWAFRRLHVEIAAQNVTTATSYTAAPECIEILRW